MEVNEYLLSHKDDGKDDTGIYLISRHEIDFDRFMR